MEADDYLKLWAVVGPLLTGVGSALWARHIRVKDREFESALEQSKLDREEALKRSELQHHAREAFIAELKSALTSFMASSHEYVRKQTDSLNNPTPELKAIASSANDKFTGSGQAVMLIGDEGLENAAVELWNATISVPKRWDAEDNEYANKLDRYRRARTVFNQNAKRYLAEKSAAEG